MKPIDPAPSRAEQAYHAILDEICEGGLAPGTHLVQEELAAKLGVSRQPIQQAMALLKSDGLVQELGARGLYVAPLDLHAMKDHYAIRGALDGLAAARAAEAMAADRPRAAEIETRGLALIEAGRQAVRDEAIRRLVRLDIAFHRFIYEISGNPLIAATVEPHWRYLRRVMGEVLRHGQPGTAIWQQHQEILSAIVRGDGEAAAGAATRHAARAAESRVHAIATNDGDAIGVPPASRHEKRRRAGGGK